MKIKLKDLIKENILGDLPSSKLIKMKWNPIKETNPDGTISPNEDKEMNDLLDDIESQLEDLTYEWEMEVKRIGGDFRSPGYKQQVLKRVESIISAWENK